MFKFSKIVVLFVLVLSLVACSSTPTNISKNVYNDIIKIQSEIDRCFNNEKCNYLQTNESVSNSLLSLDPETEAENRLLLDTLNLSTILISHKTEFQEHELMKLEFEYKQSHNKLSQQLNKKNKY